MCHRLLSKLFVLIGVFCTHFALAEPLRVLPEGELPRDVRLGALRTLHDYFPFDPPDTQEGWSERSARLKRKILVALGLWPLPTRTPLEAVIHGRREFDDYVVEKVYFQSHPGHYVSGNLYHPPFGASLATRYPGVLAPHGHWPDGRFYKCGDKEISSELESGAEFFECAARSPIQARCVQLARMGCVVFHYDMVGFADSGQLLHAPDHRESMSGDLVGTWGFSSPQAVSRLQSIGGLQTYNSIRALDFLLSLPSVDTSRIGVSGSSGGGTQTFLLTAIDSRVHVSVPVVMVSTGMQGGCLCENASYLRIDSGNIDFAALAAPRPLALVGARDWTIEILEKGFPEIKRLYQTLGVVDRVHASCFPQFGHNYNASSRGVLYRWFNRHLGLGFEEPIREGEFEFLEASQMTVWGENHPRPPGGEGHEKALLEWITRDAETQLAGLSPEDSASLEEYRRVIGGAFDVLIGRRAPKGSEIEWTPSFRRERADHNLTAGVLRLGTRGEEIPVIVLSPREDLNGEVVVWIHPRGKSSLFDSMGRPWSSVRKLLEEGFTVVSADLLLQGEFVSSGSPARPRLVESYGKKVPELTYGYNSPLFARRVHDILLLLSFVNSTSHGIADLSPNPKVHIAGLDGAGRWVAAAVAQAGNLVDRVALDTRRFRFERLSRVDDADFLPGAVKYGDLPALIGLCAPHPLWLVGEGSEPHGLVAAAYYASGRHDRVTCRDDRPVEDAADLRKAIVEWLISGRH